MAELLTVPEVAAGATEVLLSEWLVQAGASVRAGDPVAVVETDKAVLEIESDADGVLLKTLVEPGTTIGVGSPMALLASTDEAGRDPDQLLAQLGVTAAPATAQPPVEAPAAAEAAAALPPTPTQLLAPAGASASSSTPPDRASEGGRAFVSPIARRLLREAGLDAGQIAGTGPGGRVVRRDVERALADHAAEPNVTSLTASTAFTASTASKAASQSRETSPAAVQEAGFTEEPHSRLRRAIASRLAESKRQVPHFYLQRTVRLDPLLALRAQVNAESVVRMSVNDFIVRAVAVAYADVPEANVIWTDEALRHFTAVDIGVAIASERGLVTPVVRSVERSTVSAISRRVKEFVQKANTGTLAQRDLEGGSICVTNLGMYGVEEFAAIINPPHSAILAVGAAQPGPVVVEDEEGRRLEVQTTVQLVLSVDHRAIDGALAARWFDALVKALESPLRLLF